MTIAWLNELRRDLKRYKETAIDSLLTYVSEDRKARFQFLVDHIGLESRNPEITEAYAIACCETAFLDDLHTKKEPQFGGPLAKTGIFGVFSSNSQLYAILAKARKAYQTNKLSQTRQLQTIQTTLNNYHAEMHSLLQQLEDVNTKLAASKSREADLKRRLIDSFESLLAVKSSTPIQIQTIIAKTSDIRKLEEQYADKERALKSTISENEEEFLKQIKLLKSEISEKTHKVAQQESVNNYLEGELKKAKEKGEALTKEVDRLQTQLTEISEKESVQTVQQVQADLERTKVEMKQLQVDMAKLLSQQQADNELIAMQRETIRSLQERTYQMQEENVNLTLQNRHLHENPIIRTVKNTKQTLAAIEAAREENKKLTRRMEEMSTEVADAKAISATLADELTGTKKELTETRSALAKARTFAQAQEEIMASNNSSILKHQAKVEAQKETIAQLEAENSKLKANFKTKIASLVTTFFRFFFTNYAVSQVASKKDSSVVDMKDPETVNNIAQAFANTLVSSAAPKSVAVPNCRGKNSETAPTKSINTNGATMAALVAKNSNVFSHTTNGGNATDRQVAATPREPNIVEVTASVKPV